MNPAVRAELRRRAARRRRLRRARLYPVMAFGPQDDRARARALGGHVCQPFVVTALPGGGVRVDVVAPVHSPQFGEHICPRCRVERADYEGPGAHLPTCPNCGSDADPEPLEDEHD